MCLSKKQNNDFVSVYRELLLTHLRGAFSSKNHMPSRDRKFSHGHSHPIECLRAAKYIIIVLEICYNSSVSKHVFQQRTTKNHCNNCKMCFKHRTTCFSPEWSKIQQLC